MTRGVLARPGIDCLGSAPSSSKRQAPFIPNCNAAPTFHGCRLRPQPRPRRRTDEDLRAEPLCVGDGDESPDRGPRHRRRRLEGARFRLRPAATYERASDEHRRLGISGAANRLDFGTRSASSPATATRPSTSTTGASACVRAASSNSGDHHPRSFPCEGQRRGTTDAGAAAGDQDDFFTTGRHQ